MRNYAIILLIFIAFVSCNTKKEQITFETLTYNEKALLFPDKNDTIPYATLSYKLTYPKTFKNAEKLEHLQKIFQEYFWGEGYYKYNSPKEAQDAYVKSYIENYRQEMQADFISQKEQNPDDIMYYIYSYTDEINDSITLYNDAILSFRVSSYSYSGGARPTTYFTLKTIDLNSLKEIKPKDVFIESYETELAEIIRSKLLRTVEENGGNKSFFFDFEDIMPNDNFYLTQKGVQFTYNAYKIASGAVGHFDVEITYQELQHILQQEKIQSYFKDVTFENTADIADAKPIKNNDITDYQNPEIAYVKNDKLYFYYQENEVIKEFKEEQEPVFNCTFHSTENKLYYTIVKNGTLWLKQVDFRDDGTANVSSLGNFNISKNKCISETTNEKSKLLYHQNKVYLIHDFIWDMYSFGKVTAYDLTSNKVKLSKFSPHQIEKKAFQFKTKNPALSTKNQQLFYTQQGVITSLSDNIDFNVSKSEESNLEFVSFSFSADKTKLLFGVVEGFGDLPHGPFCVADTDGKNQQKLIKDGLPSEYKPLWIGNQLVFIRSKKKTEDEYIEQICITNAKDNAYSVIDENIDYFTVKSSPSATAQKEKLEFVVKNLEKATFQPVREGWQHDYGISEGGLLNKYEYIHSLLGYEQLQAILDYPIFLSGPHTKSDLNLNAEYSFGHYNPKFVSELRNDINEIISNKTFVKYTKPIIEKYDIPAFLKKYKTVYDIIKNNVEDFNEIKTKYLNDIENNTWGRNSYRSVLPDIIRTEPYWNWGETSYHFWVRRDIDNTKEIWIGIINDILNAYGYSNKSKPVKFYNNIKYTVTGSKREDERGYNFHVYNKKTSEQYDFNLENIKHTIQLFYGGVVNDYLVIDEGTGSIRNLIIVDMSNGKIVKQNIMAEYYELKGHKIHYWRQIDVLPESVSPPPCNKEEGVPDEQYGYIEKFVFNFKTLEVEKLNEYECVYFQ